MRFNKGQKKGFVPLEATTIAFNTPKSPGVYKHFSLSSAGVLAIPASVGDPLDLVR